MSREESEGESESGDEMEMAEESLPAACLFCNRVSEHIQASIQHIRSDHEFDVEGFLAKQVSSPYDLIKIVTYLRKCRPSVVELVTASGARPWDSEAFLIPIDGEDPWLWTDFDFLDAEDGPASPTRLKYVNSEDGLITLSKDHFDELQKRNSELKMLVEEKDEQLMKLRELVSEEDADDSKANPESGGERASDATYFDSYASLEIHREMLSDAPRMDAFKALFARTHLFSGKAVLDVGCGTGILSMMAAAAGAAHVVGVDESEIVYSATEIVHENQLEKQVRLVKGRVESAELGAESGHKFDVIVSEWMGYFLLFEGMLSSVLVARDRFLRKGGLVFPSDCRLWLTGVSDPTTREERLRSEVCGFRMSLLRRAALEEASIEAVSQDSIVTDHALIYSVSLLTATQENCFFSSEFRLSATCDCELTALCGWFDCDFRPADGVSLTTSPTAPPTHWKQTVFYLRDVVRLRQGESLGGRVRVEPRTGSGRSLVVRLALGTFPQQDFALA